MDTLYQNYFDAFLTEAKKHIKQGIAVKCQFFPFNEGALIYVELFNNEIDNAIQRKTEKNLSGALHRTNLFKDATYDKFKDKDITKTLYYILSPRKFLLFKNLEDSRWNNQSASKDFLVIMEKVKGKYEKEKETNRG